MGCAYSRKLSDEQMIEGLEERLALRVVKLSSLKLAFFNHQGKTISYIALLRGLEECNSKIIGRDKLETLNAFLKPFEGQKVRLPRGSLRDLISYEDDFLSGKEREGPGLPPHEENVNYDYFRVTAILALYADCSLEEKAGYFFDLFCVQKGDFISKVDVGVLFTSIFKLLCEVSFFLLCSQREYAPGKQEERRNVTSGKIRATVESVTRYITKDQEFISKAKFTKHYCKIHKEKPEFDLRTVKR